MMHLQSLLLRLLRLGVLGLVLVALSRPVLADPVLVAVAANFVGPAQDIATAFQQETGQQVLITSGATGKLYAQIVAGAPFDIFLSADAKTPARLAAEGFAVQGSVFTYAIGKLTMWSMDATLIGADARAALADPSLRFVAIANPDLAPYGAAAREVLKGMDLWQALQDRIVQGQNIGQTFSLVQSGAAEIGFVARSALDAPGAAAGGSRWDVPDGLFAPLLQDAALLTKAAENPVAKAFLTYLAGSDARAVIARYGYGVAD